MQITGPGARSPSIQRLWTIRKADETICYLIFLHAIKSCVTVKRGNIKYEQFSRAALNRVHRSRLTLPNELKSNATSCTDKPQPLNVYCVEHANIGSNMQKPWDEAKWNMDKNMQNRIPCRANAGDVSPTEHTGVITTQYEMYLYQSWASYPEMMNLYIVDLK